MKLPLGVFLAALAFFLPFGGAVPVTDPVEANYALTAKEMALSGDWLSPRIYGHYWFDKPVMIYWLIAASYKLFGIGEFAARLPSAVFSAASLAFAAWFTARLYASRLAGVLAALALGTSLEYWVLSRMIITDAVLFFFSSVALAAFYLGLGGHGRRWYVLAYGSAALAVLTKGPVGLVLPGIIIFVYIMATRRWRLLGKLYLLPGLAVFALVAAPWYLAMYNVHGREFVDTFLGLHNYLRATVSEHPQDNVFYYYLVLFPVSLLPWTGVLFRALAGKRGGHFPFLAVWIGATIGFYTLMATKYPTYVFPAAFPAAVLIGRELEQMRLAGSGRAWLWLALPAILLLVLVAGGAGMLPGSDWAGLYMTAAAGIAAIIRLQLSGRGLYQVAAVGLAAAAVSFILITRGLTPLAEARSAKSAALALPAGPAAVAAFGDYPTSAVFYSGRTIPRLVESQAELASRGLWAGKYTMPTETLASFAARTAGEPETYLLVDDDNEPPLPGFSEVGHFGRTLLYKRDIAK